MNSKKIVCHEPTYGSLNCSSSEFLIPSRERVNCPSLLSESSPWNNNLNSFNLFSSFEDDSPMPPCTNSNVFAKSFETAPSSFSSAEYLTDFPQFEHQITRPSSSSLPCLNPASHFSHSWETFGNSAACDKRQKLLHLEEGMMDGNLVKRPFVSVEMDSRYCAGFNLANSLLKSPKFQLQNEKKHSKTSMVVPITSYNPSSGISVPSKTRIRWTPDLHEKFVECVNCLGGGEKATPKGILKLMDSDVLTIYHIKSHLQKYRLAKFMTAPSEDKLETESPANELQKLDPKTGIQFTEALRIQLQVQRHLHEQLEIQRNLQIRIEAQSRQLQKLFKEQLKSNKNLIGAEDRDDLFPDEQEQEDTPQDTPMLDFGGDYQNQNRQFSSKIS